MELDLVLCISAARLNSSAKGEGKGEDWYPHDIVCVTGTNTQFPIAAPSPLSGGGGTGGAFGTRHEPALT